MVPNILIATWMTVVMWTQSGLVFAEPALQTNKNKSSTSSNAIPASTPIPGNLRKGSKSKAKIKKEVVDPSLDDDEELVYVYPDAFEWLPGAYRVPGAKFDQFEVDFSVTYQALSELEKLDDDTTVTSKKAGPATNVVFALPVGRKFVLGIGIDYLSANSSTSSDAGSTSSVITDTIFPLSAAVHISDIVDLGVGLEYRIVSEKSQSQSIRSAYPYGVLALGAHSERFETSVSYQPEVKYKETVTGSDSSGATSTVDVTEPWILGAQGRYLITKSVFIGGGVSTLKSTAENSTSVGVDSGLLLSSWQIAGGVTFAEGTSTPPGANYFTSDSSTTISIETSLLSKEKRPTFALGVSYTMSDSDDDTQTTTGSNLMVGLAGNLYF